MTLKAREPRVHLLCKYTRYAGLRIAALPH
jgi:hypothetical protein